MRVKMTKGKKLTDEDIVNFFQTTSNDAQLDNQEIIIISKKTKKTIRKIDLKKARDFIEQKA